jgi:hypothetical protein
MRQPGRRTRSTRSSRSQRGQRPPRPGRGRRGKRRRLSRCAWVAVTPAGRRSRGGQPERQARGRSGRAPRGRTRAPGRTRCRRRKACPGGSICSARTPRTPRVAALGASPHGAEDPPDAAARAAAAGARDRSRSPSRRRNARPRQPKSSRSDVKPAFATRASSAPRVWNREETTRLRTEGVPHPRGHEVIADDGPLVPEVVIVAHGVSQSRNGRLFVDGEAVNSQVGQTSRAMGSLTPPADGFSWPSIRTGTYDHDVLAPRPILG